MTILPELPAMDAALRLGAATLAGAALGLNREIHGQSAGLRTHALVALGTALITLVGVSASSGDGEFESEALSRVVQGITAGIGFLGGGAILKGGGEQVRGLTTAATLWVACGLGIACASGLWHTTLIAVALTTLVLVGGRRVDDLVHRWFPSPRQAVAARINRVRRTPPPLTFIPAKARARQLRGGRGFTRSREPGGSPWHLISSTLAAAPTPSAASSWPS